VIENNAVDFSFLTDPFFLLGAGILSVPISFFVWALLVYEPKITKKIREIRDWPYIEGVIVNIKIKGVYKLTVGASFDCHCYLTFSYIVNGKTYTSKTSTPNELIYSTSGPTQFFSGKKEIVLKKYSPGTSINVYYNPNNPQESVLFIENPHLLPI
jgi:hypothetical protein